ncbi:ninja-family protein [Musa troglodytarum]|uniref:Ninja-family protein n=1 Tax=Musa troglodytarum TaxID=320322 RepID=A0A9E7KGL3_9LILI|nr:ninja-family protein [Musa troglodytarum]
MEHEAGVERERKRLLSGKDRLPRDLLLRFVGNGCGDETMEAAEGDSDEIELTLGLSLGGCLGADRKEKKLFRSSSTASFSSLSCEPEFQVVAAAVLTRTSSLPAETEEDRRKRKEMQSLKRLEAKRKRLVRKNSIRSGAAKPGEKTEEDADGGKGSTAAEHSMVDNGELTSPGGNHSGGPRNGFPPPGLPARAAVSKREAPAPVDVPGCCPPVSQGSIGSQGSISSGKRDDIRAARGFGMAGYSNHAETKSGKARVGDEGIAKKVAAQASWMKETERRIMEEMPFVSTRGDGPNGRRVEGFLYKYRKGEEVRIVCVCHGSFLTPAEFVKHAGGGDVANPLRHIVVNSFPIS